MKTPNSQLSTFDFDSEENQRTETKSKQLVSFISYSWDQATKTYISSILSNEFFSFSQKMYRYFIIKFWFWSSSKLFEHLIQAILIFVKRVYFQAIQAKFQGILCLVSTIGRIIWSE